MKKISTNSWHFKFLRFMDSSAIFDYSLCPYVRKLIINILIAICVGAVLSFFAVFLVGMAVVTTSLWILIVFTDITLAGVADLQFFAGNVLLFAGVVWSAIAFWHSNKGREWRYRVRAKRRAKRRDDRLLRWNEPNIFVEWLRALHDKVCPAVIFVIETPQSTGKTQKDSASE